MHAASFTRSLIATTGIALLLSGAALAQTTAPAPASKPPASKPPAAAADTTNSTMPNASAPRPVPPAPSPLAREDVSKIIGASVYGPDDKKIGTVSTVLMQPNQLKIDRLVVAEGGLLGIGSHLVAVPVDEFQWDSAKGVFKVTMTDEEVKAKPAWKEQLTAVPQ